MCGLAGMIGNGITGVDNGAFYTLAYISGLRGLHSTGIVQGRKGWRDKDLFYTVEKGTFNVGEFFAFHENDDEGNKEIGNSVTDNFLLMHMRSATRGSITPDNAHPFEKENIIGMHNGTLTDAKYQSQDGKTDSELLFDDIDANGIIPVVRDLAVGSAYALVMLDKATGDINIIRNAKRTLFACFHRNRNVMYYASEASFLNFMADRHNLTIGPVRSFEPELLWTISPDDVKSDGQTKWRTEPLFPKGELLLPINKQERTPHTYPGPAALTTPKTKAGRPKGKPKGDKPGSIGDDGKVIDIAAARPIVEEIREARLRRLDEAHRKANATPVSEANFNEPWQLESGVCVYPRSIPVVKCVYCHKRMSLYEQYKGTTIQTGMHSCHTCEEDQFNNYNNSEVKVN